MKYLDEVVRNGTLNLLFEKDDPDIPGGRRILCRAITQQDGRHIFIEVRFPPDSDEASFHVLTEEELFTYWDQGRGQESGHDQQESTKA